MLKDLPIEDLPRERLLKFGVSNLSNAELISIILGTGTKNLSVKDLASSILKEVKSVSELKDLNISKLKNMKGMGLAKSANLIAALELGKRVYTDQDISKKVKITNAIDCYRYFANYIKYEHQENFMVVYLDNQQNYIAHRIIFKGTINQSLVHPREVLKEGLLLNSNKIIVMHNHPSGVVTPSKSDDQVTSSIIEAGSIVGIKVLDHIIVSKDDFYSYIEEGRIRYE